MEQLKTGTTTVGIVCKDGIVLAADKRATAGNLIAQKKAQKIHEVTDKMAVTIAGSVADIQLLIKLIRAELRLKEIREGKPSSVKSAATLLAGMVYQNIRKMSMIPGISHFLFGGVDAKGLELYDIFPDGSIAEVEDFIASGSGSVFAFGVLETLYKPGMSVDEGADLALKAITAALARDSASGNGVDLWKITKNGVEKISTKIAETSLV
ncbi:proteasome subunit beta [Candidatus Woesearchaeota archaeon]|jgi:proteasome beta subunit|nr:MAG: proteasome subunit beta [Candidatus Woesearchaeota archaeon]